jgi:hypothetical protein
VESLASWRHPIALTDNESNSQVTEPIQMEWNYLLLQSGVYPVNWRNIAITLTTLLGPARGS